MPYQDEDGSAEQPLQVATSRRTILDPDSSTVATADIPPPPALRPASQAAPLSHANMMVNDPTTDSLQLQEQGGHNRSDDLEAQHMHMTPSSPTPGVFPVGYNRLNGDSNGYNNNDDDDDGGTSTQHEALNPGSSGTTGLPVVSAHLASDMDADMEARIAQRLEQQITLKVEQRLNMRQQQEQEQAIRMPESDEEAPRQFRPNEDIPLASASVATSTLTCGVSRKVMILIVVASLLLIAGVTGGVLVASGKSETPEQLSLTGEGVSPPIDAPTTILTTPSPFPTISPAIPSTPGLPTIEEDTIMPENSPTISPTSITSSPSPSSDDSLSTTAPTTGTTALNDNPTMSPSMATPPSTPTATTQPVSTPSPPATAVIAPTGTSPATPARAPTFSPTENPTDPLTEAATQVPSEAETEAATQDFTNEGTEGPTDAATYINDDDLFVDDDDSFSDDGAL